jgi:hypothetical protein
MRFLKAVFFGLAIVGICGTAWRVLPPLWDTNVIDCIVVAAALAVMVLDAAHRVITGRSLAE